MVSPQKEKGYTAIANEIMEALSKIRIPGEQMQCLLFLIRKTYGFNKKEDRIANSQFVRATGINKANVHRAIKGLIDKQIVIKKDTEFISRYQFNKDYRKWKALSKKITVKKVVKKDIKTLSKKTPTKDTITKDNKDIVSAKIILKEINSLSGRKFEDFDPILKVLKSKNIKATEEDCLMVVNFKYKDDFIRENHFTPSSLFRITKFKSKLDEAKNDNPEPIVMEEYQLPD